MAAGEPVADGSKEALTASRRWQQRVGEQAATNERPPRWWHQWTRGRAAASAARGINRRDRGAGVEGSEEYFTKIGVETGSIGSTKAIWRPGPPLRFGGPVRNKKLGPTLIKSLL
jgi:hypothetical protein